MIKIIFKNGKEINFNAEKVGTTRNNVTGELVGIKYENADAGEIPLYLNLSEVIAVCDVKKGAKENEQTS